MSAKPSWVVADFGTLVGTYEKGFALILVGWCRSTLYNPRSMRLKLIS
jgi:hypothetical protein